MREDEQSELRNFAARRKRDYLGKGTVHPVPHPNIKCSQVSLYLLVIKDHEICPPKNDEKLNFNSKLSFQLIEKIWLSTLMIEKAK